MHQILVCIPRKGTRRGLASQGKVLVQLTELSNYYQPVVAGIPHQTLTQPPIYLPLSFAFAQGLTSLRSIIQTKTTDGDR